MGALKRWLIALFGKGCDAARARAGSKGATQIPPRRADTPRIATLERCKYDTYLQQPMADPCLEEGLASLVRVLSATYLPPFLSFQSGLLWKFQGYGTLRYAAGTVGVICGFLGCPRRLVVAPRQAPPTPEPPGASPPARNREGSCPLQSGK